MDSDNYLEFAETRLRGYRNAPMNTGVAHTNAQVRGASSKKARCIDIEEERGASKDSDETPQIERQEMPLLNDGAYWPPYV